jgi:hypothetical protein
MSISVHFGPPKNDDKGKQRKKEQHLSTDEQDRHLSPEEQLIFDWWGKTDVSRLTPIEKLRLDLYRKSNLEQEREALTKTVDKFDNNNPFDSVLTAQYHEISKGEMPLQRVLTAGNCMLAGKYCMVEPLACKKAGYWLEQLEKYYDIKSNQLPFPAWTARLNFILLCKYKVPTQLPISKPISECIQYNGNGYNTRINMLDLDYILPCFNEETPAYDVALGSNFTIVNPDMFEIELNVQIGLHHIQDRHGDGRAGWYGTNANGPIKKYDLSSPNVPWKSIKFGDWNGLEYGSRIYKLVINRHTKMATFSLPEGPEGPEDKREFESVVRRALLNCCADPSITSALGRLSAQLAENENHFAFNPSFYPTPWANPIVPQEIHDMNIAFFSELMQISQLHWLWNPSSATNSLNQELLGRIIAPLVQSTSDMIDTVVDATEDKLEVIATQLLTINPMHGKLPSHGVEMVIKTGTSTEEIPRYSLYLDDTNMTFNFTISGQSYSGSLVSSVMYYDEHPFVGTPRELRDGMSRGVELSNNDLTKRNVIKILQEHIKKLTTNIITRLREDGPPRPMRVNELRVNACTLRLQGEDGPLLGH